MTFQKPWSIQLELTEGCNRRCSFCGIHSLYREKEDVGYRFMTIETARMIAKDLNKWLGKIRLEFALQGEPLLNPNYNKIFQIFRNEFPKCQIMVTTNADPLKKHPGFNKEKLLALFQSGVNILVADYYGEKWDTSYKEFVNNLKNDFVNVYDFYKDKPKVWQYVSPKAAYIVTIDNTNERNFFRSLNNQAGNTNPDLIQIKNDMPQKKKCHLPFREIAIKFDGSVMMCCMDWQREAIMGQFPEQTYKQIWNGPLFDKVRKMLYQGRRDLLSPCDRCNYHPVKVGLIQNPGIVPVEELVKIGRSFREDMVKKRHLSNKYADKPFRYE